VYGVRVADEWCKTKGKIKPFDGAAYPWLAAYIYLYIDHPCVRYDHENNTIDAHILLNM
jgi:hypothetical protein